MPEQTKGTSFGEDYQHAITRIDTLQKLLNGAISQQAIQAYESSILHQIPRHPIDFNFGVDLETDNLVTHLSKLWLREEPDQSFFQSTHPALVKLRQQEIPRWKQSNIWNSWAEFQSESKYQQLSNFDPLLLPKENECRELFQRFIMSYNWYFELLTQAESNLAQAEIYYYQILGLTPTSREQWTRIALALSVCRLTLASSDWVSEDESKDQCRSRYEKILNWCDLSVMALQRAGMDQNPTVDDMRVVIILTSTIYFETDYGLLGSTPQMFKLYEVALDMSERLNLHREPPPHLSSKEKDERRRMWWALVTIDAHFCSTGASSRGALRLQNSDTRLPAPRKIWGVRAETARNLEYSYLRSSRSRFDLGKINNKCCHLLAQRRPLPTLAEIWKLDQDLVALEENVPIEHRLTSDLDLATLLQRPLRSSEPMDDALRNGQLIFYVAFWHIRSKIHRGLLYLKDTCPLRSKARINVDLHRDIVRRCSYSLVHLYRYTDLPTAFTSAIVGAALTLLLELLQQPSQTYRHEIRTIALECFSRFQNISSPIIHRACKVLEYFLRDLQPHVGIPIHYSAGFNKFQTVVPFLIASENASENINYSYVDGAHETQSMALKGTETLITDSSSGVPIGGNNRTLLHDVQNSSGYEMGTGSSNRTLGFTKEQPITCSRYQTSGVSTNGLQIPVHEGAILKSQDTIKNPSTNEFIGFEFGGCSEPLEGNSQILDTSGFHVGSSDLVTFSGIHSTEYETHLEAIPTSLMHRSIEEVNLAYLESNLADQQNTFFGFTGQQPMIDFANPVPQVSPDVAYQYQETLQQSEMDGLLNFRHNPYPNNLHEDLGRSADSPCCPILRIQSGGFLSNPEAMPRSTITDPDVWCDNIKEKSLPWIESAHSPKELVNLSAEEEFIGLGA